MQGTLAVCNRSGRKEGQHGGEVGHGGNAITFHPMLSSNATVNLMKEAVLSSQEAWKHLNYLH